MKEEKIICEGNMGENKTSKGLLIGAVIFIITAFAMILYWYNNYGTQHYYGGYMDKFTPYTEQYDNVFEFYIYNGFDFYSEWATMSFCMLMMAAVCVLISIFLWLFWRCELTVTNKRVYGKAAFGKRVDLPLKQISSLGMGIFGRVSVSTSSGHISFWLLENKEEIFAAISELVGNFQDVPQTGDRSGAAESPEDAAESIKKFKELLDAGVITQEEFDTKRKQILGL